MRYLQYCLCNSNLASGSNSNTEGVICLAWAAHILGPPAKIHIQTVEVPTAVPGQCAAPGFPFAHYVVPRNPTTRAHNSVTSLRDAVYISSTCPCEVVNPFTIAKNLSKSHEIFPNSRSNSAVQFQSFLQKLHHGFSRCFFHNAPCPHPPDFIRAPHSKHNAASVHQGRRRSLPSRGRECQARAAQGATTRQGTMA